MSDANGSPAEQLSPQGSRPSGCWCFGSQASCLRQTEVLSLFSRPGGKHSSPAAWTPNWIFHNRKPLAPVIWLEQGARGVDLYGTPEFRREPTLSNIPPLPLPPPRLTQNPKTASVPIAFCLSGRVHPSHLCETVPKLHLFGASEVAI